MGRLGVLAPGIRRGGGAPMIGSGQAAPPRRACPVCGSNSAALRIKVRSEPSATDDQLPKDDYSYFTCAGCGATFLGGLPTPEQLGQHYESDDYHTRRGPLEGGA